MFILFILPYCFFVSALPQDEFIFEVPNEIHPVVPDIGIKLYKTTIVLYTLPSIA